MKKRLLALMLAAFMVFAMVGCGSNEPAATTPGGDGPVAEEVKGVTVPAFSITVNGVAVTNETMADYPVYSVKATSTNSAGTESTVTYVGFAVKDVLAACGLTEGYTKLTAAADDGYTVEVTGEEAALDTTLIAISQDGSQFSKAPWFAPCSNKTTGNYLKGCVALTVDADVTTTPDPGQGGASGGETAGKPEILDRTDKVEFAVYSFKVNGKEVTNDTLKDLKIYKITASVTNSKGNTAEEAYTGYRLSDVLAAAGVTSYEKVTAVANDGYKSEYEKAVADSEYTLVAIEKDKATGEDGTIWVAPCGETSSKLFAKLVVEITAE